jgi:DNA-binding NarL/FixJ family response regulator
MISPRDAAASRSGASAIFPFGPARPLRVLVVDDHLLARCSIRWQLQEMSGLQVVGEAVDGFEAVALARTLSPDLVFMDICMPGLDGLEATRRIKAASSGIRVIILSSLEGESYRKAAREAGAAAYLVKGQTIPHLAEALQQIFGDTLNVMRET